jgi:hypothetical protein
MARVLTGKSLAKLPVRKKVAGTCLAVSVLRILSTAWAPEPPSNVSATILLAALTEPQFVLPSPAGAGYVTDGETEARCKADADPEPAAAVKMAAVRPRTAATPRRHGTVDERAPPRGAREVKAFMTALP